MPKRDTHRVMPHPAGGWQVKRDGASKAKGSPCDNCFEIVLKKEEVGPRYG